MKDDNYMKERYEELQALDKELKSIEAKLDELAEQEHNVMVTKDALEQFKKIKEGEEILVPLSNGIFFKANIKDSKGLIVNVGKEILVDKTPDETIALMEEQLKNIESYRLNLINKHKHMLSVMEESADNVKKEMDL